RRLLRQWQHLSYNRNGSSASRSLMHLAQPRRRKRPATPLRNRRSRREMKARAAKHTALQH
ncbi:hypothetical protein BRN55_19750, partial [Xanthomonas oryzae pv. oryzae]